MILWGEGDMMLDPVVGSRRGQPIPGPGRGAGLASESSEPGP